MKPLCSLALALLAAVPCATAAITDTSATPWDDNARANPAYASPESPYLAPGYDESTGLAYDDGLGVDPIYSTPSIYEDAGHDYPRFYPNDVYAEYFGRMSFSGGHGNVQVTNVVLTIPFVNPRQAAWAGWHLDFKGTLRTTWLDCEGQSLIDEDNLYTLGVQASVARMLGRVTQLQLGFTPQYSSDFDVMSHHNFYLGGYVAFSVKAADTLRYTLGVAFMPDYFSNLVLPVVSLHWRYSPSWELRVEASRVSAVCVASERFQWGPFFQYNTGVWTVHRDRHTQQLRMNNCIVGLGATYDHKLSGGSTLGFMADLGCAFDNQFRIRDASDDCTLEKYRTHPGLYARLGFRVFF